MKLLRPLLVALLLCAPFAARADSELDIVKKARAYIGPAEKLASITAIHLSGTITTAADKKMAIEMIFQKPCQQRITATGAENIEITGLDDYEGWQRIQDSKDQTSWKLTLLGADQVRRLRANTLEHLNFYGAQPYHVAIEDKGEAVLDGRSVHKVLFRHDRDIAFLRFFDSKTGELLRTETDQGGVIAQEGELLVDGLRFPKILRMPAKGPDGSARTIVVEFDKVTLNETFAASLFAVPPMSNR